MILGDIWQQIIGFFAGIFITIIPSLQPTPPVRSFTSSSEVTSTISSVPVATGTVTSSTTTKQAYVSIGTSTPFTLRVGQSGTDGWDGVTLESVLPAQGEATILVTNCFSGCASNLWPMVPVTLHLKLNQPQEAVFHIYNHPHSLEGALLVDLTLKSVTTDSATMVMMLPSSS